MFKQLITLTKRGSGRPLHVRKEAIFVVEEHFHEGKPIGSKILVFTKEYEVQEGEAEILDKIETRIDAPPSIAGPDAHAKAAQQVAEATDPAPQQTTGAETL